MDAVTSPELLTPSLVDIIDFKWLMAGDGHRVHVENLQTDRDYACACLALGIGSRVKTLRDTANRLACALGVVLQAPLAAAPTAAQIQAQAQAQALPPAAR
jgi:hypothetical protein